jgi:hypothetical protein
MGDDMRTSDKDTHSGAGGRPSLELNSHEDMCDLNSLA